MDELSKVYLMENREGRAELENTLEIMHAKLLGKSIDKNEPILVPPPQEIISGPFYLVMLYMLGRSFTPSGFAPKS